VAGVHAGGGRMLRVLAELGREFSWTVLSLDGPPLGRQQAQAARAHLRELGVALETVPFAGRFRPHLGTPTPSSFAAVSSPEMRAALARCLAAGPDLVQVEYTPAMGWLPERTGIPVALTVHQLESLAAWRGARAERRPRRRLVLLLDAAKAVAAEAQTLRRADALLCLTRREAALARGLAPGRLSVLAPMGVDPAPADLPPPEVDLVFHGDYAHPPNRVAARDLVLEILPAVRQVLPGVSLRLLGPHATVALRDLARRVPGVELAGRVPDLAPALARGRVYVAPLTRGAGMRGKLLDALAVGLPVLTTRLGAAGLAHEGGALELAAGSRDLARAAARLLLDPTERVRRGEQARRLAARYSWSRTAAAYREAYARLIT